MKIIRPAHSFCWLARVTLVALLLAGCTRSAQSTKPIPTASEPPTATISIASPTFTTLPPTATATLLPPTPTLTPPPSATPTQAVDQSVIAPGNVQMLKSVIQISQGGANSFTWLPSPVQPGGSATKSLILALVTEKEIIFYSANPLTQAFAIADPGIRTYAVSPDSQELAAASEDNSIHLWQIADKKEISALTGHTGAVTGLAFSPDGKILASSSNDQSVRLWDTVSGKPLQTWQFEYWPASLEFSPDGKLLAGVNSEEFTIHIWNIVDGKETRTYSWTEHASPVLYFAAFSPDWKTLAWVARGTIQLMDVVTGNFGPTLSHEDFVTSMAWSPNGNLIASSAAATVNGNYSPVVILWDSATGQPINTLVLAEMAVNVAFSLDGRQLAILDNAGNFQLWSIQP